MIQVSKQTRKTSPEDKKRAAKALESLKKREDLGFHQIADRQGLWQHSQEHGSRLRKEYDRVVVLGIGGSSLGGRALQGALAPFSQDQLIFIDNVDGAEWAGYCRVWEEQSEKLSKTHWILISKSGSTLETMTLADAAHEFLNRFGLKLHDHATVITEEKDSPLMSWAKESDVETLPVPLDIGGRFSVLTPVGMLPAAFVGLSPDQFREGATWALEQDDMIHELTAQMLQSWRQKEGLTVFWSYCSFLKFWGEWTRQLWAESLGKKVDRQGNEAPFVSVPYPCLGSTDQHSVLQQIMEGAEKKFIWFLRVSDSEKSGGSVKGPFHHLTSMGERPLGGLLEVFAQATQESLASEGTSSLTLTMERLDEKSLGALFMTLMLTVGALGEALDINAFDQPGVELGKRLARQLLQGA